MTQVLPADWDCDVGSEPWPGTHVLYCQGWTTLGVTNAHLHSAYQGANAGDGFQLTNAAISAGSSSSEPFYFIFRDLYASDVTVQGEFRLLSTGGPLATNDLDEVGVMTWVRDGTVVNDGDVDVYIDNFDAVLFTVDGAAGNLRFRVFEIANGNVNVKDTETLSFGDATLLGADISAPLTLTMTAATNGSNTEVTCSVSGLGVLDAYDPFSGAVSFTQVVAPAGGTGNRVGFQMRCDSATQNDVHLCEALQVTSSGGTVLLRDEFDRYGLGGYQLAPTDATGNQGRYLSGGWFWDQFTYDADSDSSGLDGSGPLLENDSSAGTIFIEQEASASSPDSTQCAMISCRRADYAQSQHRSVDIECDAAPAAQAYYAGIVLRASQALPQTYPASVGAPLAGFTGYVGMLQLLPGGTTVKWQVYRTVSGIPTLIGSLDDTSSFTYFPGYASTFSLDFNCYTLSGATVGGPVVLELKVDGVTVPLEDQSVTGVTIASGVITDASTDRISAGSGEGLYWTGINGTGTRRVDFSNWAQETLTNAGALSPNDQASVSIADEGSASASGDLGTVFTPEYPVQVEFLNPLLRADYDGGYAGSVPKFVNSSGGVKRRRTLALRSSVVTKADRDAFWTFYDDHSGPEVPFNYTSPTEDTSRVWRFVDDSVRETKVAPGLYRFAFKIQAVL